MMLNVSLSASVSLASNPATLITRTVSSVPVAVSSRATGASLTALRVTVISCVACRPPESVSVNVITSEPWASATGLKVNRSLSESVMTAPNSAPFTPLTLQSSAVPPSSASLS